MMNSLEYKSDIRNDTGISQLKFSPKDIGHVFEKMIKETAGYKEFSKQEQTSVQVSRNFSRFSSSDIEDIESQIRAITVEMNGKIADAFNNKLNEKISSFKEKTGYAKEAYGSREGFLNNETQVWSVF